MDGALEVEVLKNESRDSFVDAGDTVPGARVGAVVPAGELFRRV